MGTPSRGVPARLPASGTTKRPASRSMRAVPTRHRGAAQDHVGLAAEGHGEAPHGERARAVDSSSKRPSRRRRAARASRVVRASWSSALAETQAGRSSSARGRSPERQRASKPSTAARRRRRPFRSASSRSPGELLEPVDVAREGEHAHHGLAVFEHRPGRARLAVGAEALEVFGGLLEAAAVLVGARAAASASARVTSARPLRASSAVLVGAREAVGARRGTRGGPRGCGRSRRRGGDLARPARGRRSRRRAARRPRSSLRPRRAAGGALTTRTLVTATSTWKILGRT